MIRPGPSSVVVHSSPTSSFLSPRAFSSTRKPERGKVEEKKRPKLYNKGQLYTPKIKKRLKVEAKRRLNLEKNGKSYEKLKKQFEIGIELFIESRQITKS